MLHLHTTLLQQDSVPDAQRLQFFGIINTRMIQSPLHAIVTKKAKCNEITRQKLDYSLSHTTILTIRARKWDQMQL